MSSNIIEAFEHEPYLIVGAAEVQRWLKRAIRHGRRRRKTARFMRGEWLGHPLHPIMTDIAIGGYTVAWFLDLGWAFLEWTNMDRTNSHRSSRRLPPSSVSSRLKHAADYSIAVGLLGSALSVATGPFDWAETKGRARTIGLVHAATNATGTAIYVVAWLARKRQPKLRFWLSMLGTIVLTGGAYLGGYLVYNEGVGVKQQIEPDVKTSE